mgnify:CR=1 FL=1
MRKEDLAAQLAQNEKLSAAQAADELDEVTFRILKRLRQGRAALLPGLGRFQPGPPKRFQFQKPRKEKS